MSGRPTSETFAAVARALLAEKDVQHTLQRIVDLAVETIDGCDYAGTTFLRGGKMSTPAASNDIPGEVDAIQYETGEGPCLDAIREHQVFATGDLGAEPRWPNFSQRAHDQTGVTSMLCFRLFVAGDTLGALSLYSQVVNAFDEEASTFGSVFAAHAAIALSSALHDEQMDDALRSRDVIGQAKGILMAREGLTADQAFDMLRQASQRLNVKLRKVAEEIAYTGQPPGSASPADGPGDEGGA